MAASSPIAAPTSEFLGGLSLDGAQGVLGSLALELATALEEAPGYSKARLARESRELVGELSRAELERRRDDRAARKMARTSAEHEAGVRRQKALLAELGGARCDARGDTATLVKLPPEGSGRWRETFH